MSPTGGALQRPTARPAADTFHHGGDAWRNLASVGANSDRTLLSPPVKAHVSVGEAIETEAGVVGAVVVMAAEQLAVVEVGSAAVGPGIAAVMRLAPRTGHVASLGAAGSVADE